jgi:phenylpropionate dioxygenase-like ring-hydroxylating dioxygenase large terminal subunit
MERTLSAEIKRFDVTRPLARARTIPSSWYRDARIADVERGFIFGKSWQLIARCHQLANPGSFVTASIAGEPVLVVRDTAGILRAFFNVCSSTYAVIGRRAS